MRAVKMHRNVVEQEDLEESIETVIAGYQRKGAVISPEEKKVIAYHEIGHALVAAMQKHSAPVHKITIIPPAGTVPVHPAYLCCSAKSCVPFRAPP